MVEQTVVVKKKDKADDGSTNAAEIARGVATASTHDEQADVSTAVGPGPKVSLSFSSPRQPPTTESTDAMMVVDDENNQADFYKASSWTLEDLAPFAQFGRYSVWLKVQWVVLQTWLDQPVMSLTVLVFSMMRCKHTP